jgi:hypothetical protein
MKIGFLVRNPYLKSSVVSGLTGLAGFAAGVLVAGLIALQQTPSSEAAESPSLPVNELQAPRVEPIPADIAGRATVSGPWVFESAPAAPARDPGKNRPDRLSAPEGWTYAPSAAE